VELILQKEEEQCHDAAKDYNKLQKKFKNKVIVDEYTQEGLQQNKDNDEREFRELFGQADDLSAKQ
jgi:hypothetical protein